MKNNIKLVCALAFAASSCTAAHAGADKSGPGECLDARRTDFSDVLACYRKEQANLPVQYTRSASTVTEGVEKRTYKLESQNWTPGFVVSPETWSHEVDIYIPENTLSHRALLVINNGINAGGAVPGQAPTDFPEQVLRSVAQKTRTIVISVSNAPNQYLTYQDDTRGRREDDSVAHSWKLFLDAPEARPYASLHVPTMETAVKAMDLAEIELRRWGIRRFIAAGTSKRGWAAWHTAIVDRRVDAIVPFVFDGLNTKKMLEHTFKVYGGHWPLALTPYVAEGIMERLQTKEFRKLMDIEDPLRYLNTSYAHRLAIPKYIVNASGDDFFTPDNAKLYFDKLPGVKTLRVAPNSNHYGIKGFTENSLVPFTNRLQQSIRMPKLVAEVDHDDGASILNVRFSETPVRLVKWVAHNPLSRDFRYACGIRYVASSIEMEQDERELRTTIDKPAQGWGAMFVEAHFADGFTASTPVYISPEKAYPDSAPPSSGAGCETLP